MEQQKTIDQMTTAEKGLALGQQYQQLIQTQGNIIALNASLNTDMEKRKAVAPEAEKTKARG